MFELQFSTCVTLATFLVQNSYIKVFNFAVCMGMYDNMAYKLIKLLQAN